MTSRPKPQASITSPKNVTALTGFYNLLVIYSYALPSYIRMNIPHVHASGGHEPRSYAGHYQLLAITKPMGTDIEAAENTGMMEPMDPRKSSHPLSYIPPFTFHFQALHFAFAMGNFYKPSIDSSFTFIEFPFTINHRVNHRQHLTTPLSNYPKSTAPFAPSSISQSLNPLPLSIFDLYQQTRTLIHHAASKGNYDSKYENKNEGIERH